MRTSSRGFTVIEIIVVIALLGFASVVFFIQKASIETAGRDEGRKTAINAMYYSLEEVFYKEHGYYPHTLSADILPSVDPELFIDPAGIAIGESDSDYRYEPTDCTADKCADYTLRTTLENEADFIREARSDSSES